MEKVARFKPGENVSVRPDGTTANAQLKAGRFVTVTGKGDDGSYLAKHSTAGTPRSFGVTQRDSADPSKEDPRSVDLLVECVRTGSIPFVEAGGEISAPCDGAIGANGRVVEAEAAEAADLDTGLVADNNGVTFTANEAGVNGNGITVALVDPAANNVPLSVDSDGTDIIVTLATNAEGDITSTAAQVIAAVNEHDGASQLVTATNKGSSNGTGVVDPVEPTNLAGGTAAQSGAAAVCRILTSADEAGKFVEVDLY
jgi:hypothetical protein